MTFARLLLIAIVFVSAVPMMAAPYDLVLVGDHIGACFFLPFSSPRIEWHPSWAEDPTNIYAAAAAPGGRVFAGLSAPRVEIVELRADQSRTPFFSGLDGVASAGSLVVDRSGNVYVLTRQAGNESIVAISSTGALVATYPLTFDVEPWEHGFDLAEDQCTAFIGENGAIHRFNVCTGTPLSDFATTPVTDLAVLPDGGVLAGFNFELRRYSAAGTLTSTTNLDDSVNAIGLRNGGQAALLQMGCDSGELRDVNLVDGTSIRRGEGTFVTQARDVLPGDGWTAAIGAATAAVPTLEVWMAVALGLLLVLTALRRLG
ncbi:MAG TPA: hypothetical protein VEK79_09885 [Thermoanaerobaculia bacterium]|nr:hypothetical protein [Thermoanaerobaculia bacterium]